jgi:hypothetical protein
VPHHDPHGGRLAADLEGGLEVGDVIGRREHDGPGGGDPGRAADGVRAEVAAHEPGPGGLGPVDPLGVRVDAGDDRHGAAAAAQSFDDLEAEPTETADDDGIHGGRV